MNPPGYLAAILAAVKEAAPELGDRVRSGFAPLGLGFPYAVVTEPASSITPHSSRRGHASKVIEISVFSDSSEGASALEWRIGPAISKAKIAEGVHADFSVDGWAWTGTVPLTERPNGPDGDPVFRRALSFRLILTPKGTLR